MTTDLNAPIAERLERYCQSRGINRGTRAYCELLASYRRNPHFAELLDAELARMAKNDS